MNTTRHLTIYKASAGSGKTFRLAYEYIKHTLGVQDTATGRYRLNRYKTRHHRPILAVTFTNKATEEMKRRILRELDRLRRADDPTMDDKNQSPYRPMLLDEFRCSPAELAAQADKALRELLFDYNFFNVSTIDTFFQTVLRTFAHEAEVTGNYSLQLDNRFAVSSAVEEMLSGLRRGGDAALARWIKAYMLEQVNDSKTFNIFNRNSAVRDKLISFVLDLTGEDYQFHEHEILEYLRRHGQLEQLAAALQSATVRLQSEIKTNASQALLTASECGYPEKYFELHLGRRLEMWANGNFEPPTTGIYNKFLEGNHDGYLTRPAFKAGLFNADITDCINECIDCFRRLGTLRLLGGEIYKLGLFSRVIEQMEIFCRESDTILLSDTNKLLSTIIGDDTTPFVYERIGLWLRHFLVDEFQDTSKLQWENMRPLIAQSLSEGNDNLIIGDEKQCIYRFRNSDPSLLGEKVSRDDFPDDVRHEGDTPGSNTNYRSRQRIVEFNNRLFSALSTATGQQMLYANVSQCVNDTSGQGYVRFHAIDASTVDDFRQQAMADLASEIRRQLNAGYAQQDIAILVRRNSEATEVIDYLLSCDITTNDGQRLKIVSDEALTVGANAAIKAVISQLRHQTSAIAAPRSDYYTSDAAYKSLIRRYQTLSHASGNRSEALRTALAEFRDRIPEKKSDTEESDVQTDNEKIPSSLFLQIEQIISSMSAALSPADTVYLLALQDIVADFCAHSSQDSGAFLRYWDTSGHRICITSASDIPAVRIMTIHKAKGLEFPCVHIPFVEGDLDKTGGMRWYAIDGDAFPDVDCPLPPFVPITSSAKLMGTPFQDEFETIRNEAIVDELNVLYVAFTRAANELSVNFRLASTRSSGLNIGTLLTEELQPSDSVFIYGEPTAPEIEADNNTRPVSPSPSYRVSTRTDIWALASIDTSPDSPD